MKRQRELNRIIISIVRLLFLIEFIAPVIIRLFRQGAAEIRFINMFTALLGFLLTFLPEAMDRISKHRLRFSSALSCVIVIFIFCAEFLGEIKNFYFIVPWWDTMLHSMSGVILGLIGFVLVYVLNESERTTVNLSPGFICFFAFCFALAAGAVWEIFEFAGDRLLNMNMQKFRPPDNDLLASLTKGWDFDAGLVDTMEDIICDALSAFATSAVGYAVLKFRQKRGIAISKSSAILVEDQPNPKEELSLH